MFTVIVVTLINIVTELMNHGEQVSERQLWRSVVNSLASLFGIGAVPFSLSTIVQAKGFGFCITSASVLSQLLHFSHC